VEIAARHRKLLDFHFEGLGCVYCCLPFGVRTSAYVTAESLRRIGLVSTLTAYVDDFGGSVGPARNLARVRAIVRRIESFGWTVAPGKNKLLGFKLDTTSMTFGILTARLGRLLDAASYVLDRGGRVTARKVCELAGMALSM